MKIHCQPFGRTRLCRGVVLPLISTLALGALGALGAHAADAGGAAADDASGPESGRIENIIVTANKRAESLQDVPMAVSVLSAAQLQNERAFSFADYAAQVPGLNIVSFGEGMTQLVLRGISTGSRTANATVGTYVDDVPYGSSTVYNQGSVLTPDIDPFDLQRVEVLRGPQGTLYGANTLGGLIKFVTAAPDASASSARVSLDGSHVEDGGTGVDAHAMVNVPLLQNTLALRVSAYERTDPGYIDNVLTGAPDVNRATVRGGRAQLLWTPNTDLSVRFSAIGQDLRSPGLSNGGIDVDPATLQPLEGENNQERAAGTGRFDVQYRLFSLSVDDNQNWAKLSSITSYSTLRLNEDEDVTASYQPALGLPSSIGLSIVQPIWLDKITQELRLQSPQEPPQAQPIAWRVGVFYQRERSVDQQNIPSFDTLSGAPIDLGLGPLANVELDAVYREWALYADGTWHATPQLSLTLGARYSDDRTSYTQTANGALLGGVSDLSHVSDSHPVTFLVNPSYQVSKDVLAYVRIASGFRPGGPNVGVPADSGAPATFNPDKLVSYEVGFKDIELEQRLSLDFSVFYIDWTHVQLEAQAPNGVSYLSNGGKASSRGAELSIRYTPLPGTEIYANGTYTDAHLNEATPQPLFGYAGESLPWTRKSRPASGWSNTSSWRPAGRASRASATAPSACAWATSASSRTQAPCTCPATIFSTCTPVCSRAGGRWSSMPRTSRTAAGYWRPPPSR